MVRGQKFFAWGRFGETGFLPNERERTAQQRLRMLPPRQAQLLLRGPFAGLSIWTRFGDPFGPPNH